MLSRNVIKAVPVIITTVFGTILLGTQYKAEAIISRESNLDNLQSVTINYTNKQLTKDTLVANNNQYWWGPKRDFQIWMPGLITINKHDQLGSKSSRNNTEYMIMHQDTAFDRVPKPLIPGALNKAMRKTIGKSGKVIRSRNLAIGNHPGLELMVQHSDGSLGQYQAFVVKQRLYFLGAKAGNELTTESANFFNSFRVYPQRVSTSNYR